MKIAVISPIRHSGTTVYSILLGHAIALSQNLEVMLMSAGKNRRLCEYLGVNTLSDKTRSISQVVKLLSSNVLEPKDLNDYSTKISNNMYIMDTTDDILIPEESAMLTNYVFENASQAVKICDVTDEIYDESTQAILTSADLVIIVIQPDTHSYDALGQWMESRYIPNVQKLMVVVNRYDEEIDALRNISKRISVPHIRVCKAHYNPLIVKCANNKDLLTLLPYVLNKDPRVIELNTDFKEACQLVISHTGMKFRWEA